MTTDCGGGLCTTLGSKCHGCIEAEYGPERQFDLIHNERVRQDEKWGWPNAGLASDDLFKKVAILMEEAGEVANAVLERDHENLKTELVQVAAVCVAWLESIEEFGR